MTRRFLAIGQAAILVSLPIALVKSDEIVVRPSQAWSNLFADSSVTLDYVLQSDRDRKAIAGWSLAVGQRTIARGEVPTNLVKQRATTIQIAITTPPQDDDNVLEAQIGVLALSDDGRMRLGEHRRTVWIFSPHAFSSRTQWLKQLQLTLFDPERKTAKLFDAEKIPYLYARSTDVLNNAKGGVIVIGERTSLKMHRGLADAMLAAAVRGRKVLLLAPADGQLPWPSPDVDQQAVRSLLFKDLTAISELDKRLDTHAWYPGGGPVIASFRTQGRGGNVQLTVDGSPGGWPWIEMNFPGGGAIVVCGCGIITRWADSPTPRYLLRALFERLQPAGGAAADETHAKD